jgi:hypothetical protein
MRSWVAGLLVLLTSACGPFHIDRSPQQCRYVIVVRTFPERAELGRFFIPEESRFSLSFIHSVSGTPVRSDYLIAQGRIIQIAEVFETHEAGLPYLAEEPDASDWERENGRFRLRMERPINHLVMRTDRRYRNRLHIGGRLIDLNRWGDRALELEIHIQPEERDR